MAERRKGSRPPEKRRSRPSGDPPLRREVPADSRPQTPPRPPKNRAQRRAKGKRSSPPPSRPGAYTGQREEIAERTIRLRNKRAQGQMRRRRRRRRLMHVALVTIGLIACMVFSLKVLFQVNGVRIDLGESSVYYQLPQLAAESSPASGSQSQPADSSSQAASSAPPEETPVPESQPAADPASAPDSAAQSAPASDAAEPADGTADQAADTEPPAAGVGVAGVVREDQPAPTEQPTSGEQPDFAAQPDSSAAQSGAASSASTTPATRQGATVVQADYQLPDVSYTVAQVVETMGVSLGDHLLEMDLEAMAQTLEQQLPWLENVRVRYRLPNTLVVQADPAHPRYALVSEDQWATVSSRLKVLQLDSQQPQGLVSLDAGKAAVQVGQQLVLQTDPEPVDEAAILGQEDLSNEEKAAALEQARQEAQTAAQEASNQRMESLQLLLQTLDKWNLSAGVTSVTVADDMEMQFGYQGRIQVLVGTSNQLDYKIQFSAEILAHQLSASDRGTLDSSNILSSGELQPVFSRDIS